MIVSSALSNKPVLSFLEILSARLGCVFIESAAHRRIRNTIIERLFQLLFWTALVFAFVMASLPQPPGLPGDPSDKVQHILAFLVLSGLAAFAYPRLPLVIIFLGLAAFGGAIEAVQVIPQLGRQPSWLDWLSDVAAISAVLLVAGVFRLSRRDERAPS